jgi:hypothetical protein
MNNQQVNGIKATPIEDIDVLFNLSKDILLM